MIVARSSLAQHGTIGTRQASGNKGSLQEYLLGTDLHRAQPREYNAEDCLSKQVKFRTINTGNEFNVCTMQHLTLPTIYQHNNKNKIEAILTLINNNDNIFCLINILVSDYV